MSVGPRDLPAVAPTTARNLHPERPRPVNLADAGAGARAGWLVKSGAGRLDVVVMDAGLRQGLVSVRSLGRSGLRVGAVDCVSVGYVPSFASRCCAARAVVPDLEDGSKVFVDDLLELLKASGAQAVIPIHDGSIDAIESRRGEVERYCAIALAESGSLKAANDKAITLDVAKTLGIRVPRSVPVLTRADIGAALNEIGLPAVVKPIRSWVETENERNRLGPLAVTSREEASEVIGEMLRCGAEVLLQEWVPGERVAVSFVYAKGRFWGEFAQVAHRMMPILGGNSVARESIVIPDDVGDAARRLVAALDLEGYAEVEFRRDADGTPLLMEINPRLSASVELAVRAGVDFPKLAFDWATGRPLHICGYLPGVRMRWLGGDLKWVLDNARFHPRPDTIGGRRALGVFLRDFRYRTGYDYVDVHDLRPAAIATIVGIRASSRTVTKRFSPKAGHR